MKNLIAATVLAVATITSFAPAQARSLRIANVDTYGISKLNINPESSVLPQHNVQDATLTIDRAARKVTLTVTRGYYCPPNAICTMQMPAPVVVTLPITHQGSGFCGGQIITAEEDKRPVDGMYLGIRIFNDNGNFCERNGDDRTFEKPINVEFVEQSLRDQNPIVSTMEGFRGAIESAR